MISIVIPSLGRDERLGKMLGLIEQELPTDAEIIVVADLMETSKSEGRDSFRELTRRHPKVQFITTNIKGCWRCTNVGLDAAKYDFVMWTADDALPRPGWFWAGVSCFRKRFGEEGLGLLILNDLMMRDQVAGHAMTTKRFLNVLFGQPRFPESFNHLFCDTMTADWARSIGRLAFCEESILEHMHWQYGKSERDKTNILCEVWSTGDKDTKDKLDLVWFNGGGREVAMKRLGISASQVPPKPRSKKHKKSKSNSLPSQDNRSLMPRHKSKHRVQGTCQGDQAGRKGSR